MSRYPAEIQWSSYSFSLERGSTGPTLASEGVQRHRNKKGAEDGRTYKRASSIRVQHYSDEKKEQNYRKPAFMGKHSILEERELTQQTE